MKKEEEETNRGTARSESGWCSARRRNYYSELVTGSREQHPPESRRLRRLEIARRDVMSAWNVLAEKKSPNVRALSSIHSPRGHPITKERWITFPGEPSISFPGESFAPKVQMQLDAPPRQLVRNVEMERRRRLYKSLKLELLFQEEGISNEGIIRGGGSFLGLELFDDEEYDCRTATEWMGLGRVHEEQHPVPGQALIQSKRPDSPKKEEEEDYDDEQAQRMAWSLVAVLDYDPGSRLWQVLTLDGAKRKFSLPRLYLRFLAEDPRIFVKRVAAALRAREHALAHLKYHLYLDCMPHDEISSLSDEQKYKIVNLAVRREKPRALLQRSIAIVMHEIERNYHHALFDLEYRNFFYHHFGLSQDPDDDKMKHRKKSQEPVIKIKNFSEVKEYLQWYNLYVNSQVYEAMVSIIKECRKVAEMKLFYTKYGKSLNIEEFYDMQVHSTRKVINYLKERWTKDIELIVKMCLRDVGKGSYDLKQRRYDVYEVTKLKRFMELIKKHMENTLRVLVERSSSAYLAYLETPTLTTSKLEKTFAWDSNFKSQRFQSHIHPIFELEIDIDKKGAFCTTDPHSIEERLDSLYVNTLQLSQQIQQVHPMLLENLKFPKNLRIQSVSIEENLPREVRKRIQTAYGTSVIPLSAYVKRYDQYSELYNLDVVKYAEKFTSEEYAAYELKEEVQRQYSLKSAIEADLPERLFIGAFNVKVEKLKAFLMKKRQDLAETLMDMHARNLRSQAEDMIEKFRLIYAKLALDPTSVEQIYETREWMDTLPVVIAEQLEVLQKLKGDYDVLEPFCRNLSDEDFQTKYEALRFPSLIQARMVETYENLVVLEKEEFFKIQLEDENTVLEKIEGLMAAVANISIQSDMSRAQEIAVEVKRIWKNMKETQEFGITLNLRQKLFGVPVVPFENLTKLLKSFEPYKSFWTSVADWLKWHQIWMSEPLMDVDGTGIEELVTDWYKIITRCTKVFQDLPDLVNLANRVKDQIDRFKPYIVPIQALRGPGIKERHLKELGAKIGINITEMPDVTFAGLISHGIMDFVEEVKVISESAEKEHAIEVALKKMIKDWETITMDVLPYKDTDMYIMKLADEVQILLEDHILNTQQLGFSPFKANFEEEIDDWASKLKLTKDVLIEWIEVQKVWMYLEPIFSSEDISRQLPLEAKKYNTMERNWRRIMKQAHDNRIVIKMCPDKSLLESLRECMSMLEVVTKGLSEYLESRRMIFPRFFFLSDDELLEILAQAKNVRAVQPHLKKCFENMKELEFDERLVIRRMYSSDGEEVLLRPPVLPRGGVEHWLGKVEEAMCSSLRHKAAEALNCVESLPRKQWVFMWPGQISLCGGQTSWTGHVERAIAARALKDYFKVMISQLEELRELVRKPQTEIQRLMLEAIITIEVHARDVTQTLIQEGVHDANDFNWISQLRYYWVDDSDLKVRAVNAEFQYGYEYLGNNGRLVITPLTDRCYLTLTGALHLKFGGAPAGPAGTGKTETTKDLAKALAIQCVVFNCSDQLDFMSMGKFFKGLASSGAWACFDEFNRIDVEVLSVIAQQIMTIQKAQQTNADRFYFEGVELSLRPSCAVFITMNPGYAGRTELPDNLKALFRPVAMMVPNYALIAEISLFSCGFGQAKALATKITATFKLSSEQLSAQDHYDFGMRSVKTVIAVAGILKREQKDMSEPQICLRALRDVNVPKFLRDDLILFNGIVSDLFPKIEEKQMDYAMLTDAIHESIDAMKLAKVPAFVQKVIQLYETTIVRHGLMLVGQTGAGKTTCYKVLQKACGLLKGKLQPSGKPFTPVQVFCVNPKSITMGQLYGEFDLSTHEWTDGIFSSLLRAGADATDEDKRWFIFDGPVDAVWIENMNTVLDDNKKLCLTSGEIIRLTPTQTMMFEVEDLRVASPATVSRCGMVYMEPRDLGITPLIECWIKKLPEFISEYAEKIFELALFFLLPALKFLRKNLKEIVTSVDSGVVQSYINLMNCQIETVRSQEDKTLIDELIEPWSTFALIWSIGATCDTPSRYSFDEWLRNTQRESNHRMQFPAEGLVYDYRLLVNENTDVAEDSDVQQERMQWVKWLEDKPFVATGTDKKFSDIQVPTVDMERSSVLIHHLLSNDCNVLCVGPAGSGKTLTVSSKLSRDMPKKYICDFIVFSARTSANHTQDLIDSKLDKRRRGVYGPPINKRQIFFIDDVNMPMLEVYGAQPPIELLRQYMDFRGWYDRKEIGSFKLIQDVNFVCAMAPPGGGRNPVTPRLLRHFHFIALPEMEDGTKRRIFGAILSSWLVRAPSLEEFLEPLITSSLKIFSTLCKELLPTPDKCHYTFNVRDLGKVFQGMLMAEPTHLRSLDDLLLLWYHENLRVFRDRLVYDTDRNWFEALLGNMLKEELNYDISDMVRDRVLFYGDFCNHEGQYERIPDARKMESTLVELLEDYNNSTTVPINLVLFEDATSHICRITRILRQSPGNALLLGMGGSGRQSLTKLSAHIAENNCIQIELTKAYSIRDWRDDIKNVLLKTGLHQKPTVFLFSDVQIKYDVFLEDINNVLSSGDVPNIYQSDELNLIFQAMRNIVQESGLQVNRSNLLAAYQKVIRNTLHTVITMCPIGESFRSRIRQFPALVDLCTIDWFDPWPESALRSVAFHFLSNIADEAITQTVLTSIVDTCQFMHTSVIKASTDLLQEFNRHNYVTPTSYLELISNYGDLLASKKEKLHSAIDRLSTGLEKLATTELEVKEMQVLLERMKPELEKAAVMSAKMIEEISQDTEEAEKTRVKAAKQEKEALKLKRENQMIKDDAEADLNTVRPMLEAAEASLKALNKSDITEVKAMKRPPVGVVLVIEAICIVKGVKPNRIAGERPGEKINDYWSPGSQLLADAGQFLASLENYNKEDITEEMIQKLKPYIENPSFHPKKIMKVSKACHSLCMWLHAMYNYYFVNLRVAPKMAALLRAEAELAATESALAAAMARLREVQEGLERLQERFRGEDERRRALEAEKRLCEERMGRAVRLVSGLGGEQRRWRAAVREYRRSLGKLLGDVLLSAGAIAYLTPFPDAYRKRLLAAWYGLLAGGVPHTEDCGPVSVLGDPVDIRQWHIHGLPRDALSVENAVLVMNSKRWPLFVDPQAQANRWIRNLEKEAGLSTVRMTDKDIMRVIENCVRFGRPCLIENVGLELEASLDTVFMKALFKQAGQASIKIGDNIVPYNFDFRLYLTTKLPNPHYAPEVAVKVLIVNFSLTSSGLADQMLSLVIMQEKPELEETRSALVVSIAQMKHELKDLEDRILYKLSQSEGSAVDDIDLITSLEASKVKSEEIKVKVESAELAQTSIDAARSLYVPIAERAQVLFFCLLDLQLIDPMYQYSLEWFIRIFVNSMTNTEKNDDVSVRLDNISEYFTFSLYSNVCRSLFEKNKLHYAFLLCIRIQMMDNLIDLNEWKFLLSGAIVAKKEPNPAPAWLTVRCWTELQSLQVLPKFETFLPFFKKFIGEFKRIFDSQQPETEPFPEPWNKDLDDLEKLLVLKCLRPDKIMNAIQIYVSKYLGNRFIEPQTSGLDALYKESSPTTPLIFILSSGTDPASELYKFAEKLKMARKLFPISLGQGQGPRAELMLRQSLEAGNWAFFQNCHLAPSWMPTLEIIVERLPPDGIHRDFRLWLTSMPSKAFPVSILQNGSKITMEPPRGVKANILRAYSTQVVEMQEFMETEDEQPKVEIFKALIFSLSLFHAVLLERRKFGPLGFNIPYEFTDGDFVICMSQLHMFLLEYAETPFKVLIYTAGHINYGGRITDDWDRRCVLTILRTFYNELVLAAGYQFDIEGHYVQPALDLSFADYISLIKRLPINDEPGLFGLHANANISYAQAETYECLATLEMLQPREIGGAVKEADESTGKLAQQILEALPGVFDLTDIQKRYPVSYEESLNTVLLQEATRYNGLLNEMSSSLKDLLLALKGHVVMSEKLETMALSLRSNKVPENWQSKAFASLKPLGAWVEDLKRRASFMRKWQEEGTPASFWISGFYFPQALLTGTLQNYARKYGLSIDSIDFAFKVLGERPSRPPEDGCVVYGLFLEGCRWDGKRLAESLPRQLFSDMAPVLFSPEIDHKLPEQGIYECPVYKTVVRAGTLSTTGHSTNFILSMEIPSEESQAHWIMRGVALICSLDF